MQKKVLIPVLMAVPAALPAMADINMGFPEAGSWSQLGTTGDDNAWSSSNPSEGLISCVVGTGYVDQTLSVPQGKYRLIFQQRDNIKVLVGSNSDSATEVAFKNFGTGTAPKWGVEFDVAGNNGVYVKIAPEDVSRGFSFIGQQLVLVFDDNAAVSELKATLDELKSKTLLEVVAEDDFAQADAIRERLTAIQNQLASYNGEDFASVWSEILKIGGTASVDEQIAIYKKYGFNQTPSAIEEYLTELGKTIDTYNSDVEAENAIWQIYLDNVAAREKLLGEQATLANNIAAISQSIAEWKVVDEEIKKEVAAKAADLTKQIADYKVAIEAAYPLDTNREALREVIEFTDQAPAIQIDIDNLASEVEKLKADYDVYYNVNFMLLTQLNNAYEAYCGAVNSATGIKGFENIYDGDKDELLAAAKTYYDSIKSANQIPDVEDAKAYDEEHNCSQNIQAAIEKFVADTETYNNMVETQNANMTAALLQLNEFNSKIAHFESLVVPAQFKEEFNNQLSAIKTAVTSLTDYVHGQYEGHTLEVEEGTKYAGDVAAIQQLIDKLEKFHEPFDMVNDLMNALEEAKVEISKISADEELQGVVDIYSKFIGTFASLEDAILNLNSESAVDSSVVDPIQTEIESSVANAQEMADAFKKASSFIAGLRTSLDDLNAFVDAKKIGTVPAVEDLKKAFREKYTADGAEFPKAIADYNALLQEAAAAERQACWQEIQALCKQLDESTLLSNMDAAKVTFAENATDANMDFADAQYVELEKFVNQAREDNVTHASAVILTEISKTLYDIRNTEIPAAKAAEEETAPLGVCDDNIEKALDTMAQIKAHVQALIDNQNAYDQLVGLVNDLQERLDAVSKYNEETSLELGLSYYKDQVIPAIQAKIDQLLDTDLPASLENESTVADRAGENGYDARIAAIGAEIDATRLAIEANNTNHNNQLAREKEVRTYIENLIAEIESNENAADLPAVKGWISELQSLISNDIVDVNIKVTDSYGKGMSAADNEEIMALYQAIYDKAHAIDLDYHGDAFHQAVVDANADMTQGWAQLVSDLWDQYREGIRTYNYFYYDLSNKGWRDFIHEAVKRHASLFQYYEIITNLNEEAIAAIAAWNEANHVITKTEWEVWTDKASTTSGNITADVNALLAETDALAAEYYTQQEALATGAINDATALLNAAGISLDCLDEAIGYRDGAVNLYLNASEHVSLDMDEIADELDKVIPAINLQKFAEDAWVAKYSAAQTEIDALREEINGYNHAKPEVKEAALQSFAETVGEITTLNSEVSAVTEGLINRFKEDADNLEALLDKLRGYRDEVKKSNDLNKEDEELQNNFDNVWLPDMNSAYDALRQYCETLGGCASMENLLSQLRNSIDAISELVAHNGGNLVSLDLENRCKTVLDNIAAAYQTAFEREVEYLRQLLKNTKIAFNDAYVHNAVLPEGNTYDSVDAEIEALVSKIEVLRYNEENKNALHDEALGYETELCRIYNMLQQSWTGESPAAAILNALNARYDSIAQNIASGVEFLDGCMDSVKEEFAGKYGELKTALDAEKSDWSDDGDHIIARETYYQNALNQIEAEVNALTENIRQAEDAAQAEAEKQRVSNERYDALKAEYDSLSQLFEDAKTLVESYGNGIADMYSYKAAAVERKLAETLSALEAAKAEYSLTADSQLLNGADILASINDYKLVSTRRYAAVELQNTGDAASDASNKLATLRIVPADFKVLSEEYRVANNEYQALLDEKNNADFDRLNEIITRARELADVFASISDRAVENSYILGDVNLDENGEVNVLDVQMLINMIGQGVTYQELYAENPRQACAADITGNEQLNIADVTALIQMILGDDVQVVRVAARKPAVKAEGGLSLALVEEADGVRRYALMLNGGVPFTGGQFDIRVSGNASVAAVATSGRTAEHDAYLFDRGLGDSRVVLASMQNSTFAGTEGVIAYIDVEGDGELTVENALFSDTNNIEHEMGRAHTSAVDAIIDYCKDGAKKIYDAAGRTFNSLQRGINIILHKDGSVTKELRK